MSQCAAILQVLNDGRWHTTAEIHQRAGFSRLNSRVSDLRKHDCEIECRHVDGKTSGSDAFEYRLTATPGAESPRGAADSLETTPAGNHAPAAVSLSAPGAGAATATAPDLIEGQMSLEDVAA